MARVRSPKHAPTPVLVGAESGALSLREARWGEGRLSQQTRSREEAAGEARRSRADPHPSPPPEYGERGPERAPHGIPPSPGNPGEGRGEGRISKPTASLALQLHRAGPPRV